MGKLIKRTKAEREEHLNLIAKMYVKGRTQMDMARELGISQGQVSNDLKLVLEQWRETRIDDIDSYKNEQLHRINIMEAELWAAWEKSKTARKVVTTKSKSGEINSSVDLLTGSVIKTEDDKYWKVGSTEELPTNGDMQFMNGIMWCLQERAKLVGLYAPKKVANTDPTGAHEAGQSAKEILGDLITGILKRADSSDKQIVEGELLALDGDNAIDVVDDAPELAKRLRAERIKKLPPHPDDIMETSNE